MCMLPQSDEPGKVEVWREEISHLKESCHRSVRLKFDLTQEQINDRKIEIQDLEEGFHYARAPESIDQPERINAVYARSYLHVVHQHRFMKAVSPTATRISIPQKKQT